MSVEATGSSNYMSDAEIMDWMQLKTEDLYGTMRQDMGTADDRAHVESELGDLKALLAKPNTPEVTSEINAKVKDLLGYQQFPDVVAMLSPLSANLDTAYQKAANDAATYNTLHQHDTGFVPKQPDPVTYDATIAAGLSDQIKDKTDALGKDDQLSLISIQDVNSQISQAKETASNLIDSENKSASAIIANLRA